MCDRIKMPDGAIVESVRADGNCLCKSRDKEILGWIVNQVSDHVTLEIGIQLTIARDPFGWVVDIGNTEECMYGLPSFAITET